MILEMNAAPNAEWCEEFQSILIKDYHISRTDAIFIVGTALHCIRKQQQKQNKEAVANDAYEINSGMPINDWIKAYVAGMNKSEQQIY